MGMFDDIRCNYPLPDGHNAITDWQTKDTPSQFLDLYEITDDGRLRHLDYDIEDRSCREVHKHDLGCLRGMLARVNERWVDVPFDGDIYFYSSHKGEWVEYRATFRADRVTEMTRIKQYPVRQTEPKP